MIGGDLVVLYSLGYALFAVCLVAPPTEFVSAGLTVQTVLSSFLGSEQMNFVGYHIRRTTATMIVHSLIPLGYYIGNIFISTENEHSVNPVALNILWKIFLAICLLLPFCTAAVAYYWSRNKWQNHPIAKLLQHLAPSGSSWHAIASSINIEFRRFDKFSTGLHGRRLIVTDSWLILTSTYYIHVGHQGDIHLSIVGTEEHQLYHENATEVQFLNITVTSIDQSLKPFRIRLNAVEYSDLKDKLRSPILNARNVVIRQSLSDRFLEAFRYQVAQNEVLQKPNDVELEQCIGCMQTPANVKLQKLCSDPSTGTCLQCYCRPMWCLECMSKWFASRQDQSQPETWMSSRSPCPTCRATFCMLDVCRIV